MAPSLPGEVTDRIIRFVWPYKTTLCSCALVCRDWLPASRVNLFYEVQINSAASYDSWVNQVLRRREMKPWLSFVRRLIISDPRPDHHPSEPPRRLAPRDLQRRRGQRFLHEFANQLPGLQNMTVVNLDWITLPPHWSTHMVLGSYAGVRKFGLRGCHFSSFNTLRRMLSALPSLVHLSMQEVGWPPNRMPVLKGPENGFPRPALEYLIIHGQSVTYSALFEWLVNTPSQHTLKELWYNLRGDWTDAAFRFLRQLSSTVTKFSLPLYTGDTILPLSQFSNLDLLRVEIIGNKDDTSYRLKVPPMLQDLRYPPKELHLVFSFSVDFVDRTSRDDITMDLLDSFLQQPVFEKLRRVTFQVPGMNYVNARDNRKYRYTKLEALTKRLPKTAGRRILAVAT